MTFIIRKFRPSQYKLLKQWTTNQKWNPGIHDYLAHQKLDGFWMGELNGEPITCIGAAQYDTNFTHLGAYIVKPEHRNKGYGLQLWNKVLPSLTSKTIGFYAVQERQQSYTKVGFKTHSKSICHYIQSNGKPYQSPNLVNCKNVSIEVLSKYDNGNFPSNRTEFLQKWINFPETYSVAFVSEGNISGYGVIRPAIEGYKIGPLFANEYQTALQIYKNLVGSVSAGQKVFIDMPDINPLAMKLARELGMMNGQIHARMLNEESESYLSENVYGITGISFG